MRDSPHRLKSQPKTIEEVLVRFQRNVRRCYATLPIVTIATISTRFAVPR